MSIRYEIASSSKSTNTERFGYEEILYLLNLCEKYEIVNQSLSKGYSLVRAFTPIYKEMQNAGYNRSLTQVIDKFRKLKLRFVHAYLARKKGKLAMSKRFEHYKKFEKLIEGSKTDVDSFIRKFSKKEGFSSEFDYKEDNFKDDSNSKFKEETNYIDYDNTEDDSVPIDDEEIIEKVSYVDDFENDEDESYQTGNLEINLLPTEEDQTNFAQDRNSKDMNPTERTIHLLEQLVPTFKKAQEELQEQFFIQQRELQRQQQEWEERILDEEREFFTKLLSNLNNSSCKTQQNDAT